MGSASRAKALERRSVESSKWWLFKIYRIGLATLRSYSSSELTQSCIYVLLMAIYPTVNPEQTPAKQLREKEMSAYM